MRTQVFVIDNGTYSAVMCVCYLWLCIEEFATYLKYARHLDFYETPKYDYLRQIFANVMARHDWSFDWVFDWTSRSQVW